MEKFDVFISFKNSDKYGERTQDAHMAEELFYALKNIGIKAFYSNISIPEKGEHDFGNMINDALEQADIFIAVGTSIENLTSQWVRYEIECFNGEMLNGNKAQEKSAMYSYVTKNVATNKLPMALRRCQSFNTLEAVVNSVQKRISGRNILLQNFSRKENQENVFDGIVFKERYKVLNKIGQGGSSSVYRAYDVKVGTDRALKAIKKNVAFDFNLMHEILMTEVAMLKRLEHRFLPKIIDVDDTDEHFVVVMDFIPGATLDYELKKNGIFNEERAIAIFKQMCEVLGYLHSRTPAIIYRDVKPANIMLRPDGTITLIDFGTAREYKENGSADTTLLGTVGYAAPEQFGGMGQTDARTDIYALGVTVRQMLTGINPRKHHPSLKDDNEINRPVRELMPDLSRGIEYIIRKCTFKDPDLRYQSTQELLDDLENIKKLSKRIKRKEFLLMLNPFRWITRTRKRHNSTEKAKCEPAHPKQPPNPDYSKFVVPGNGRPVNSVTTQNTVNEETSILGVSSSTTIRACVAIVSGRSLGEMSNIGFFFVTKGNRESIMKAIREDERYDLKKSMFITSELFSIDLSESVLINLISNGLLVSSHEVSLSNECLTANIRVIQDVLGNESKEISLIANIMHNNAIIASVNLEFES